jgi:hypothetical protein
MVSNYPGTSGTPLTKIFGRNAQQNGLPAPGDVLALDLPHTELVTAVAVNSSGNGTIYTVDENAGTARYSYNGTTYMDTVPVSGWLLQSDVVGWLHDSSGGHAQPGDDRPSSIVTYPTSNGGVNVFYPGPDGNRTLNMAYWNSASAGFQNFNTGLPMANSSNPSAVMDGAQVANVCNPNAPLNNAGTVRVYYVNRTDGYMHEDWWNPVGAQWADGNTGRRATGTPSAAVRATDGAVEIFYADAGNSQTYLEVKALYPGTCEWMADDFGQAYPIIGNPYTLAKSDGSINVFYQNANDHKVHLLAFDTNGNRILDEAIGGIPSGDPVAVQDNIQTGTNNAGCIRVYYTNAGDGYMHESFWYPNGPGFQDYPTGRDSRGTPSAAVDPTSGSVYIFYSDTGPNPAHFEEFYLTSSPPWQAFDYNWKIIGDPDVLFKPDGEVNAFYDDPTTGDLSMWFNNTPVPITYADLYPIAQ